MEDPVKKMIEQHEADLDVMSAELEFPFVYNLHDVVEYQGNVWMIGAINTVQETFMIHPVAGGRPERVHKSLVKLLHMALPHIETNQERCPRCGTCFFAGYDCTPCSV